LEMAEDWYVLLHPANVFIIISKVIIRTTTLFFICKTPCIRIILLLTILENYKYLIKPAQIKINLVRYC